jgi:hypothetical protein
MKQPIRIGRLNLPAFTGFHRDFMMNRTPSSLVWLMEKHSRAHGELLKHRKQPLDNEARIKELETELASLTATLGLHEVQVNPADIKPRTPRNKVRILPHGETIKLVLECLRLHRGQFICTDVILEHVVTTAELQLDAKGLKVLRLTVRNHLKGRVKAGMVERRPDTPEDDDGLGKGYWRLRG